MLWLLAFHCRLFSKTLVSNVLLFNWKGWLYFYALSRTKTHRVEWLDIIIYSWAPKRQNLNSNVVWMAKNKREKALICPQGIDKTRFLDFPKSHSMFWTTGFLRGMLHLQLQPKNRTPYEVFALSFCVQKLGTYRLFQRGICSRYEVKSNFSVSDTGFKKVNNGK